MGPEPPTPGVVQRPSVLRTLSGKKLEVPVKRILRGTDPDRAASTGALADPTALDPYIDWATARQP